MRSAARRVNFSAKSCRTIGLTCIVAGWSLGLPHHAVAATSTGIASLDLDLDLHRSSIIDATRRSFVVLPFSGNLAEPRRRDLEVLDLILRKELNGGSMPRVGAFGRISGVEDPTRGTLGIGGIDIDWRPSSTLAVAVVAGGRIDASDAFRAADQDQTGWQKDVAGFDAPVRLANRSVAFDGLGFGGESAAEANPFAGDRLFSTPSEAEGLERNFLATRAVLRPSAGSSFGLVATRGGGRDGDASLLGFDVDQMIAGQRVQAWVQHAMGHSGNSEVQADRSAVGASIGGAIGSIKYGIAWRRLGDGFESGLGNVGSIGSHAMLARMGWSIPLEGLGFLKSWQFGIRTRVETDLEFDPRSVDLVIDAARFLTVTGDQVSFGIEQKRRVVGDANVVKNDRRDRFRVGIDTNPSRPLRLLGSVAFGDPVGVVDSAWEGAARWRAAPGIDLGGVIAFDHRIDGIATGDTLRTSFDGRATLDERATLAAGITFDAAQERISLGQQIGLKLRGGATVSLHIDQDLPSNRDSQSKPALRASIKGSFQF
ncbi:MAG: hypothetical protein OSA40_10850 [Phycisphaerales bacterium]|nr:hypothetical protein [Phycisphaerales bacterium]